MVGFDTEMIFVEFLEALCRCAFLRIAEGPGEQQMSNAQKVHIIIKKMLPLLGKNSNAHNRMQTKRY